MTTRETAIKTWNLTKEYRIYGNPWHRILERLPGVTKDYHQKVKALNDINLDVHRGTCVGLIGSNGAGKSTMLKILTGTTRPSSGGFEMRGRVASLLELGAGFNLDFTGRENIYMNAALMGFGHKEARAKFDEILEFSELHDFIDAPIRTYSSGMICRLGFSVAVATDPDILIIDEILSVGDMHFQRKCADRIYEYRDRGKTMFFCSHSLYDVRQLCDQAIWLKDGHVRMHADAVTVTNEYATYENTMMDKAENATPWDEGNAPKDASKENTAHIVSATLVDPKTGEPKSTFGSGEDVGVRIHIKAGADYEPMSVAVGCTRSDGTICLAMASEFDDVFVEASEAIVTLEMPRVKLLSGEFVVPVWLLDKRGIHRFHEKPCTENLVIQNRNKELGLFYAERSWKVEVIKPAPMSGV